MENFPPNAYRQCRGAVQAPLPRNSIWGNSWDIVACVTSWYIISDRLLFDEWDLELALMMGLRVRSYGEVQEVFDL